MKSFYKEIKNYDLPTPIRRIPFDEAMENYGSDKPDLRFDLKMTTLTMSSLSQLSAYIRMQFLKAA
jgi:aspartyl-tRNA synthetase